MAAVCASTALAVFPSTGWAAWKQPVGGPQPLNRAATMAANEPSLTSIGGVPYVAWSELDAPNQPKLWVSRLNAAGTAWERVGGTSPLNVDPTKAADEPSLTSIGGVPYVAWSETDGTNKEIRVSRLNAAGTAWVEVVGGASPINQASNMAAREPSLTAIDGVPYVAWRETEATSFNEEVRVARLRSDGSAWEKVGQALDPASPINESSTKESREPSLTSVGGVPHVAWVELDADFNYEVRVARVNGAGTGWDQVVGGASPINQAADKEARDPSLTAVGGVPYVAWDEADADSREVRVSRLNGAGTAWQQVGAGCPGAGCTSPINHAANRSAVDASLIAIGGVPYVAWKEGDAVGDEIRVSRLNAAGTAWVQVVGGPDPITDNVDSGAFEPSLTSIGGIPYVAWTELDGTTRQLRVSRLEPDFLAGSETAQETSATLSAQVRTFGVAYPIGLQYGPGASLTSATPTVVAQSGNDDSATVTQPIGGLSPSTLYSWRPFGSDGTRITATGVVRDFRTAGGAAPPPGATPTPSPGPRPVSPGARSCGERTKPRSSISDQKRVFSRRRLSLTGRTTDRDCTLTGEDVRSQRRVQRIEVSISTRRKKACLFVQGNGKLSRPRPCSKPLYVRAQPVSFRGGKTTWKLDKPVTLRPGTYTAIIRATDREGNVETAKRRTNRARFRVR